MNCESNDDKSLFGSVSPFSMMVKQLENLPVPEPKREQFNPRPRGMIIKGSASAVVLEYLRRCDKFQTEGQIRRKTMRSHAAVSWALIYLVKVGLVESRPDCLRSSRYKRYRAVEVNDENKCS